MSIVCVWNDEAVRAECLDASVVRLLPTAPGTEYLPVDNRGQVHTSAGSALNSGARSATNDFVAFIHQDISLHSLVALEEAAGLLADHPDLGVLGAIGITGDGEIVGRIRDRVVLLGRSASTPVDVDSVDEVLFLARRSDLLTEPLSEHPDLAWHAYAVELGMRARSRGLRVAAVDVPLTHNSMSTNLARLDHAHATLATMYPEQVPTRTTCGDVTSPVPVSERTRLLAEHRWRARWLVGSLRARRAASLASARQLVLADMRTDIDRVLPELGVQRLRILNVVEPGEEYPDDPTGTVLHRKNLEVVFSSATVEQLSTLLSTGEPTLVTDLRAEHLPALTVAPTDVLGLHEGVGHWLLTGVQADATRLWPSARAKPWRLLVPA